MDKIDKDEYIKRYQARLNEFGYSPATLGWGKGGRQDIRFKVLAQPILKHANSSVLDIGCGFGDLFRFLKMNHWNGTYTGVDIVPGLLNVARELDPQINVIEADITSPNFSLISERFDYVVASGVFNARLKISNNEEHIVTALKNMFLLSKIAMCVDFMSTYVDYQNPAAYHTDPLWALGTVKKISRRVVLRHDYMPFEFALIVYKDDVATSNNVFKGFLDNC